MGLMAARAATRMGSRQQYRTMSRMQRRRSYMRDQGIVTPDEFEAKKRQLLGI